MRERPIDALKKSLICVIGVFGVGLAMACVIRANLGADPVTLLMNGIGKITGKGPGFGVNVVNAVLLLFLLLVNRRMIYYGTVITTLLMGVFTDLGGAILNSFLPADPGILVNWILLIFGVCLLGASIAFYITVDFGVAAVDGTVLTVQKWEKRSYKVANWTVYIVALAIGMLLGEVPGLGTLVGLFIPGIVAEPIKIYLTKHWPDILHFKEKPQRKSKQLIEAEAAPKEETTEE